MTGSQSVATTTWMFFKKYNYKNMHWILYDGIKENKSQNTFAI
jgi:hypothetical protein